MYNRPVRQRGRGLKRVAMKYLELEKRFLVVEKKKMRRKKIKQSSIIRIWSA